MEKRMEGVNKRDESIGRRDRLEQGLCWEEEEPRE